MKVRVWVHATYHLKDLKKLSMNKQLIFRIDFPDWTKTASKGRILKIGVDRSCNISFERSRRAEYEYMIFCMVSPCIGK